MSAEAGNGSLWRTARQVALLGGAALAVTLAAPMRADALTIVPTFNANMSASSKAVINQAIAFYQSRFSDPITVGMSFFRTNSGLGGSTTLLYNASYSVVAGQLVLDRTTADDNTANITVAAVDPVIGHSSITFSSANARALNFNAPGFAANAFGANCGPAATIIDGCIQLNLGITNDVDVGTPGGYSLISVVEHEMDEVLGLGSALRVGYTNGNARMEDLFRYAAPGVRSFALNAQTTQSCAGASTAYFSIDRGNTNLDGFNNCNNGGDYGDWVTHTPTQVQDAFTNNSANPSLNDLSVEMRALDVIGYDRVYPTPEPATLPLIVTGFIGLVGGARLRRKKSA